MKTKTGKCSTTFAILFFILFYAPLVSLIIFSFNDIKSVTNFNGFSTKWYKNLFTNKQIIEIVFQTLYIAILATIISVIIGTFAAIALTKYRKKFRSIILQANNLPITNPDIVTAIGLLLLFVTIGIERGYGTMLLAHISFCTPYVIITVYPKIKSLDPNLIESAMDLGARPVRAIVTVILPLIKNSIFAAAAIAFTMSFDDFVISYFTGGKNLNISTYLYTNAKKINPTFNALSVIIMIIIVLKIVIDKVFKSKKKDNQDYIDTKVGRFRTLKLSLLAFFMLFLAFSPLVIKAFSKEELYVFNCGEYIDNDSVDGVNLIKQFEKKYNCQVKYNTFESNEAALSKMETEDYDVVIPSDYAIEQLIVENKLEEIDWDRVEGFTQADITESLKSDLDYLKSMENGYDLLKYGVPYFFGNVGIVYDKDKVSYEDLVNDNWGIFKNPKYRNEVAFYDSSKDGFMVALKDLGYSMNTTNESELLEAYNWLKEMKSISDCAFKTDELLDEMPQGKYSLTFMYSGDANYVMELANEEGVNLGFYVPSSGTNIFCDAMVIPSRAHNVDLAYKFISFMSSYDSAMANTEYVYYTTPHNDVYVDELLEDGWFYSLKDTYSVDYRVGIDEIFRFNKKTKEYTSNAWAKLKTN